MYLFQNVYFNKINLEFPDLENSENPQLRKSDERRVDFAQPNHKIV